MGRGIYKIWLKKENLLLLRGWKMNGLTDEQIAANIGVNVRTLGKWKEKYGQIGQALKRGKEHANYAVENELLKKALSGNTTAIIFWLKNNYREKYSDSQKTPLEEQLTQQQIRRAKSEADIAAAKADILGGNNGSDSTYIIDDMGDVFDDDESKDESNDDKTE